MFGSHSRFSRVWNGYSVCVSISSMKMGLGLLAGLAGLMASEFAGVKTPSAAPPDVPDRPTCHSEFRPPSGKRSERLV